MPSSRSARSTRAPNASARSRSATTSPQITRASIEAGPPNIWRYRDLLPVRSDIATIPNTEPGFTRLVKADNLARELGLRTLWVKDDSGNPTHSFKDRVVAVALAAARELGLNVLACPSTGNLANAVAAAAAEPVSRASCSSRRTSSAPRSSPPPSTAARLLAVKGNYDDVNKLASEIAGEEEGWAFVNVNVRPVLRRGLQDPRVRGRRATRLAAARSRSSSRWPRVRS